MTPALVSAPGRLSLDQAYAWVGDRLREHEPAPRAGSDRILRFVCEVEEVDFYAWLMSQSFGSRGYWSDRESGFDLAGVGRDDTLAGQDRADIDALMADLDRRLSSSEIPLRYFGGLSFSGRRPLEACWEPFGTYRFVLPRFELEHERGRTLFACNIRETEDSGDLWREWSSLALPNPARRTSELPPVKGLTNRPGLPEWSKAVEELLASIDRQRLDKAVLARRVELAFEKAPHPQALLLRLQQQTQQRFHFCFQPRMGAAFLGASPERLYLRRGRTVRTEALAGTASRGRTGEEDEARARALLGDEKERREHGVVADTIQRDLSPLCARLSREDVPGILRLNHVQHLRTAFEGTLLPGVNDATLLTALHPTPAVGGRPTGQALEQLRELEPFERGWYAGTVGWVSPEAAQFAVAIRSALVLERSVQLYVGAGIVKGSRPEKEWLETEDKLKDLLEAFPGA